MVEDNKFIKYVIEPLLKEKELEFVNLKARHGNVFNGYVAFRAELSTNQLDRLYLEIDLLKELIDKLEQFENENLQ